ncbi:MAG: molybdopterin-guanine dinucleotide biosynthesis protein B [Candidatus Lokiarchaeota archaeon]|nr:molybdopterin-guanine dinucleotide biosynthesis protein B [Candidatus Lokiarchaeota archaeon]
MIKIISIIGYSNTGKTHFIETSIKLLKDKLNINTAVIKNIHKHRIDKEGKDTQRFNDAGAMLAITQNSYYETTIFIKKELSLNNIIHWLENSPLNIDVIFVEGFRDTNYPSILCTKNKEEIKEQLNDNIKIISGLICKEPNTKDKYFNIPLIDIEEEFSLFIQLFGIVSV